MIDLTTFCGRKEDSRIGAPWSAGEWTFATDGWVLVRVARRDGVEERIDAPSVMGTAVGATFDMEPGAWHTIPAVSVEQEDCHHCKGTGRLYTCPECDGDGEVTPCTEFSEYDEQTCKTCDGRGQLKREDWLRIFRGRQTDADADCENCDGTGKVWNAQPVEIGGALFGDRLLSRIAALPNAEIGVFGPLEAARFRFDGGDGFLMPRRE